MTDRMHLGLLDRTFRMCTGKVWFASRSKARKWVRHEYRNVERKTMYIYECPRCAGFHLTTDNGMGARR